MKKLFILFFAWLVMNLSSEEGQITKLNGIDLWWDSYGDQKNPTVLMIMGLNSNSKVWSDQSIKELVDNDLHVLIYDNRDIGKSSWVTEEPGLITFIKYLPAFLIESFVNLYLILFLMKKENLIWRIHPRQNTT